MKSITVKEYFNLKNTFEYDSILTHLKANNIFNNGKIDFNTLSYENVVKCFNLIKKADNFEVLKDLFETAYQTKDFEDQNIVDYFGAKNYLLSEFERLKKTQSNLLASIDSNAILWEQAGGDKLNKFNDLMPLVQLGEIYGIFPHELKTKAYNEIFVLLVLHKERKEVHEKYNELKNPKK